MSIVKKCILSLRTMDFFFIELVELEKYNRTSNIRSRYYHNFYVLCHFNGSRQAERMVCRYVNNGGWPIMKSLHTFKHLKGVPLGLNATRELTILVLLARSTSLEFSVRLPKVKFHIECEMWPWNFWCYLHGSGFSSVVIPRWKQRDAKIHRHCL